MEFGVPTRLGSKIEESQRQKKLAEELRTLEEPPAAVSNSVRSQQVAQEEADDEAEDAENGQSVAQVENTGSTEVEMQELN